ncbi:MAG: bifunctional precorrin-2 dehydrogenase/sirohydrochlorin ferrochelatase [Nitrospirae bacterium]|nr:bifunctional precorrin-2 dehydrogenase/sirohydrochlorin ferrochelatase [Nitrospirota bacterium]
MTYYPVFLNLNSKKCLLIGGGRVAQRKAIKLIDAGAHLTIVSPELTDGLRCLKDEGRFIHKERVFMKEDLDGVFLVIAATSDSSVNKAIAYAYNGLINVVDSPDECSFIVPSTVIRGDLTIAISTSGASPVLASTIRQELEGLYGDVFAGYISFLRLFRQRILEDNGIAPELKEALIKEVASRESLDLVRSGSLEELKSRLLDRLRR